MIRIARSTRLRWLALPLALALIGGTAAFIRSQPKRDVTTRSEAAYQSYQDGIKYLREIRYAEAQRCFRRAVELDSTFAMAWMRLGRVQFSFRSLPEARASYQRAASRMERLKPRERYFIRMLEVDLDGDEMKRAAFMDEMVARFPDDSEVLMFYASRAYFAREHQKALDAYLRLVQQDPSMGDCYNMIGYACVELGRLDEAVEAFQKYAFLYPEQSNPHDSLGELYLRTGRYADAVKECDKALAITPDFAWAHVHAAAALCDQGRFAEALARIRRGLASLPSDDPDRWNLQNQLINMHILAGHADSAINLCRAQMVADPVDPAPPFFLSRLHAARGETALARQFEAEHARVNRARRERDKSTTPEEDNFMLHELRGAVAASENRWNESADHFARAIGKTENWWINRRLQLERLEALVRAGRLPEATAFADTLTRVNPHEPRLLATLSELKEGLGQVGEAESLRSQAGAWSTSRLLLAER